MVKADFPEGCRSDSFRRRFSGREWRSVRAAHEAVLPPGPAVRGPVLRRAVVVRMGVPMSGPRGADIGVGPGRRGAGGASAPYSASFMRRGRGSRNRLWTCSSRRRPGSRSRGGWLSTPASSCGPGSAGSGSAVLVAARRTGFGPSPSVLPRTVCMGASGGPRDGRPPPLCGLGLPGVASFVQRLRECAVYPFDCGVVAAIGQVPADP